MVTYWKQLRSIIEEKLDCRFHRKLSDLEEYKHGKRIDWFDNGGGGIFHVRDNPTYTGVTEAIDRPLYDTQVVTTATTSLDLFTTPQGQSSKTINETNMSQAGILPSPEKFTIKRIGTAVLSEDFTDFRLLSWQIVFTFKVNSKIYTQAPLFYYPCGFGIYGMTTDTATSVLTLGVPGENGVRSLVYDIPLNPLDPLIGNYEMHGGATAGQRSISALSTLSASTELKCFLQGPYERAI